MPFIPESGRKAFLPRYHPQFAKRRTFQALTRPRLVTKVTRPFLLRFQTAAPGGKPKYHTHAAPTIPHSLKRCSQYGATRSSLLHIGKIVTHTEEKCKYVFAFLAEKQWICQQEMDASVRAVDEVRI